MTTCPGSIEWIFYTSLVVKVLDTIAFSYERQFKLIFCSVQIISVVSLFALERSRVRSPFRANQSTIQFAFAASLKSLNLLR